MYTSPANSLRDSCEYLLKRDLGEREKERKREKERERVMKRVRSDDVMVRESVYLG